MGGRALTLYCDVKKCKTVKKFCLTLKSCLLVAYLTTFEAKFSRNSEVFSP